MSALCVILLSLLPDRADDASTGTLALHGFSVRILKPQKKQRLPERALKPANRACSKGWLSTLSLRSASFPSVSPVDSSVVLLNSVELTSLVFK